MITRPLGRTGLQVSRIGLGLAALGRPGYINLGHADDLNHQYDVAAMQARAAQVLQAAYDAGIRYFDAARSYGKAEQFLGEWLRSSQVEEIVIGSKWGYEYTAGWQVEAEVHEEKQHTVERLNQQWEETGETLGSRLNLYQIHSATLESGVLEKTDVLHRLVELKQNSIAIGLSVSGPRQKETIEKAIEVHCDGVRVFDTVQATWNLLETSAGAALAAAHQAGLGVIIKEALANGRLTSRNNDPAFAQSREQLSHLAGEGGVSIDAIAIAAVLEQPWVDVVLSGAATSEHLESNVRALDVPPGTNLSGKLAGLNEAPADYWSRRSRLDWN
ncbi:aldo/keto reductase [Rubinisphaera margarita]|uniref:aldo/keto reductase n=1 Tax=Rubinisphaera margarita TaxID=2909586 RepID=UPI001EE94674|nr:aldo/keto reductase [Rubinisphaera margarita]MCG6156221.1 aldo/keto reductase [Rubinisphaera margarita]